MKEKIKKYAVKAALWLLALTIFIACYYIVYLYCGYQRLPEAIAVTITDRSETPVRENEELTLVTFNIGFGAYSDDYSFFMDGGECGKAFSRDAVEANMAGIIETLKNEDPDILLLQEVDINGTRSYHVDQTALINDGFDVYDSVTAVNYDSPYFLYPLHDPTGKNKSGIMTLSRYNFTSSLRKSLPVEDSIYKYLDLDRAYTVTKMNTESGKSLVVYNLHLSAYTSDGRIADDQLVLLVEDMVSEYESGNYVVAAGDFNKDLLGDSSKYFKRREGDLNWARPIDTWLIPKSITLYAPSNAPSCRNADSAYRGDGTDFVITVDGLLASENVKVTLTETVDVGFKNSDHNPVRYKITLVNDSLKSE